MSEQGIANRYAKRVLAIVNAKSPKELEVAALDLWQFSTAFIGRTPTEPPTER